MDRAQGSRMDERRNGGRDGMTPKRMGLSQEIEIQLKATQTEPRQGR
jgi:hypothetical protein